MLRLNKVNKYYQVGTHSLHVLRDVELEVADGEFVAIMGASGSGKSTLLNILGILDDYDSGEYWLGDTLIRNLSETRAAEYRNRFIGFIFQSFNLLPFKTALENVALPLYYQGIARRKRNQIAMQYLERVGLRDWADHVPAEMSGGQKQRVAIARALIGKPRLILADEPTGALDSETSRQIMDLMSEINQTGITVLVVTHDSEVASRTQRTIRLRDGKVVGAHEASVSHSSMPAARDTSTRRRVRNVGIAALKLLGLLVALALLVAILVVVVIVLIALVRMTIVGIVQWRDLISLDRWTEVLITIGRNKLRTALTTISVAWGIFVLVLLLGLGRGLNEGARNEFARDAMNGVWIAANKTSEPYGGYDIGRRIEFDNRDYDRAKDVDGVQYPTGQFFIAGSRFGGTPMMTKRGGKANTFQINAVHHHALALETHEMTAGRFLSASDVAQKSKAAVVGQPVVDFLFKPDENPIGQWIEVAGVPFQIVGIFKNAGGAEQERQIYIPVSTAQLAFNGADHLGMISFTVGDAGPEETQKVIDKVVAQLAARHNFSPADKQAVRVQNNVEGFHRFQQIFFILSVFVIVIGLGSLAAGVVGVSNIMMIAVKERTKEIGVRKALGATPSSIVFMVIQEAVFLTGVAGLLGLSAGVGLLGLLTTTVDQALISLAIHLAIIVAATAVLVLVASVAGLFRIAIGARVAGLLASIAALFALVAGGGYVANIAKTDFIRNPSIDISIGVSATLFLVLTGALAGYFPARAAAKINPIHALRDE